jgi:hypothetical protein
MQKFFSSITRFYRTNWRASFVIVFSILMILMLLEVKNHRFRSSDFKVYYRAAERLVQGENLYRPDIDGHYYYKYSPTAAVYFIPSTIFPVGVAKVLHWTIMALMACLGFYLCLVMVRPDFRDDDPKLINNLLLLLGLILSVHLEREFFLGQVNHILLVLYLLMIYLVSKGKQALPAFIWAGSIFIKPFGFIFLPYYLVKKQFKMVALFLVFAASFALLPMIFTGPGNFAGQYQHWFHELSVEMSAKQSLLVSENDTIFSILARYTPLRLLDFTPLATRIFQLLILAIIGLLFLYLMFRGRNSKDAYLLESGFLIAMIPLLSFTNHYAFQFIQLIVFLIVFNYWKLSKFWRIVAIAGFILTGINMHDIVGQRAYDFLNAISLVAIGAVLLQSVVINMRLRRIA